MFYTCGRCAGTHGGFFECSYGSVLNLRTEGFLLVPSRATHTYKRNTHTHHTDCNSVEERDFSQLNDAKYDSYWICLQGTLGQYQFCDASRPAVLKHTGERRQKTQQYSPSMATDLGLAQCRDPGFQSLFVPT